MTTLVPSREEKTNTLANNVETCIASFQICLNKAASVHSREFSLVEDQLARFSVWAGHMRVFGSTRQSLDHRLREAEDVRDTFDAVLDAINYRIENCTSSLDALDPEQPSGVLTDVNQVFQQALRGIADQISLLHKLSNSIRRASKELQDVEAAKAPRICDDDGNDAEDFLRQVLLHYISDRFPTTSQVIQQRLADTMVLRRKRILYRRSRYPIHVRSEPARPRVAVPRAQSTARPRTADVYRETSDGLSQTASVSKAQSATTLAAEKFHRAAAPSVVSMSRTVALSSHEELIFPSAPTAAIKRKQRELVRQREDELFEVKRRLEDQDRAEDRTPTQDWETAIDAVREVLCPFCFHVIPAREAVDELKWKQHVLGDLDAYVCLFEQCESPRELYGHSSQWLKHMREHALRWRCASKAHNEFVVNSRDEYTEHMKTVHRSRLTDSQIRVLADKSSRASRQIFEACPLCGIEGTSCSMEDHVIGHMRHLAIKSLPVYDSGESEDSEKASAVESAIGSRSTVKKFMEKDSQTAVISWGTDSGGVALSDSGTDHSRDQPSHEEELSGVSTATPKKTRMDPNCAICGRPPVAMCDCEARFVDECTEKAESRMLGGMYDDARKWVRGHAEIQVKASFQAAVSRITPGTDNGSGAQDTLVEAQEGAGEVAAAARINQLWSDSAQTLPNFIEYFYSLLEFTLPPDDDHMVRDPPISALATKRSFDSNKEPEASESSKSSKEPSNQMPMVATGNSTVIEENPAFEGETESGEL